LPSLTARKGVHCKAEKNLKQLLAGSKETGGKKEIFFLKKLVSLKRSCTFAAAYRESYYSREREAN
jgi:hypothetical protein